MKEKRVIFRRDVEYFENKPPAALKKGDSPNQSKRFDPSPDDSDEESETPDGINQEGEKS